MSSKSWFKFENKAGEDATTVYVYDEIGYWGVTAKEFCDALNGVNTSIINLKINSPGGDVFDGLAIHNALKGHAAKVNVQVEGLAASIASIIAMAGDEIRMAKNAFFMIHNAWAGCAGNAVDMRKLADTLEKIDGTLVQTYQDRTGGTQKDIREMMAAETWLNADEALAAGFCDVIGDPADVKAKFDLSKFSHVPQAVAAMNVITKPENERDLETVLRDAGLSKKEALTAVASLKAEARRDSATEELAQLLKNETASIKIKTILS
jgi:ATP-dependent protease ClpP protease subunit